MKILALHTLNYMHNNNCTFGLQLSCCQPCTQLHMGVCIILSQQSSFYEFTSKAFCSLAGHQRCTSYDLQREHLMYKYACGVVQMVLVPDMQFLHTHFSLLYALYVVRVTGYFTFVVVSAIRGMDESKGAKLPSAVCHCELWWPCDFSPLTRIHTSKPCGL